MHRHDFVLVKPPLRIEVPKGTGSGLAIMPISCEYTTTWFFILVPSPFLCCCFVVVVGQEDVVVFPVAGHWCAVLVHPRFRFCLCPFRATCLLWVRRSCWLSWPPCGVAEGSWMQMDDERESCSIPVRSMCGSLLNNTPCCRLEWLAVCPPVFDQRWCNLRGVWVH